MSLVNMRHATLHWPDCYFIDLWPLAMIYVVRVSNILPCNGIGLSLEELFSDLKCHCLGLSCVHAFVWPIYDIDHCLEDGKKIPK